MIVESQGTISLPDIYTPIPAWNPNGTRVAIASGSVVEIRNPSTQTIEFTLTGHNGKVLAVAWSPNGTQIATGSADQTVRVWDSSTGSLIHTLMGHDTPVGAVTWSPDGSRLVSLDAENQPNLLVRNPTTGVLMSSHNGGTTSAVAFSPDGSRFAYVTTGGSVHILDGNTFTPIAQYTSGLDFTNLMVSVQWSADGSRLITGSVGGAVYIWDGATAQPILQLAANPNNDPNAFYVANPTAAWVRDVAFSGDGKRVLSASGDGTLRAWDAATNQVLTTIQVAPLEAAGWSPDGSQLALVAQGSVQVQDTSNLSEATSVTSYTLVNPNTGADIGPLNENDTIDLTALGLTTVKIRANTLPQQIGSVVFGLNSTPAIQTDDTVPYELTNWTPVPGSYTLTATPYSAGGGTGTVGTPLTIHFTVEQGDGIDTIGVFVPSSNVFSLRNSNSTGSTDIRPFVFPGSGSGYLPVAGDWNGDGVDTIGVYNTSSKQFLLRNSNSAGSPNINFVYLSTVSGTPVTGDWNGDGIDTIGVYNSSYFYLRNTNNTGSPDILFRFGPTESGWIPITGDWNGDGVDTIGVYNSGLFLLGNTNNVGLIDIRFQFGPTEAGWIPITGDWNGDGVDTIGVYKNGVFVLRNTNSEGTVDNLFQFGPTGSGYRPIAGDWNGQ